MQNRYTDIKKIGVQRKTAEELLLKHEDDQLMLTIVLVENLHIH
jgi:hypothetical protein